MANTHHNHHDQEGAEPGANDGQRESESAASEVLSEAVGVSIPDEYVAAFVAEVFEDAERSTTWGAVVDAMIAPDARDAWDTLTPVEQAAEVLDMAACFDRQAAETFASIDTDGAASGSLEDPRATFEEAKRLRTNADAFRTGVASAYSNRMLTDEQLLAAVECVDFDTETIARREQELERVTSVYDFEYRPYGGTLIQESGQSTDHDPDVPETF